MIYIIMLYRRRFYDELVSYRHTKNPETDMDLPFTAEFAKKKLEEMDYKVREAGKSGFNVTAGIPDKVSPPGGHDLHTGLL